MDTTRYGLPTRTTIESLERRWGCVVEYGDFVIVAGTYYIGGAGKPSLFAAIYQYLEDDVEHDEESDMEPVLITDIQYSDAGHAIKGAIEKIDNFLD